MRTRTLGRRVSIAQYPRLSPVQAVAMAGGWTQKTAAQFLKESDLRSPFIRVAVIVAALKQHGHHRYADGLCLPIEVARHGSPHVRLSHELRLEEERLDAEEDVVGKAFDLHEADWRDYRRALVRYHGVLLEVIAAGVLGRQIRVPVSCHQPALYTALPAYPAAGLDYAIPPP